MLVTTRPAVAIFAFLALHALLAPATGAQSIRVRQDGQGDHLTISAALAAAQPGAVIEIEDDGIYIEDLVVATDFVTIRAARHRSPVVKPASPAGGPHVLLAANVSGPTLERLIFDGLGTSRDGLIIAQGVNQAAIRDCRFLDYQGFGAHALLMQGNDFDCVIERCEFVGNRRAVTIVQAFTCYVRNCLIWNQPSRLPVIDWGLKAVDQPSWLGLINLTIDTAHTGPGLILDVISLNMPSPPPVGTDIPGVPPPCSGFGDVYLSNSIVVNGSPSFTLSGPTCGINYDCFDPNEPLAAVLPSTNIYNNPLFTNRGLGDFGLTNISPCRNTGTDGFLLLFADDIEGTCRPMSAGVDRGAFEETNANCALDWEWISPNFVLHLDGPATLAGKTALAGCSLTSCPGLLFAGGRIPLALDALMAAVADPAFASVFGGLNGVLDASGDHQGILTIPPAAQTMIAGLPFYAAYLVVEPFGFAVYAGHSTAVRLEVPAP